MKCIALMLWVDIFFSAVFLSAHLLLCERKKKNCLEFDQILSLIQLGKVKKISGWTHRLLMRSLSSKLFISLAPFLFLDWKERHRKEHEDILQLIDHFIASSAFLFIHHWSACCCRRCFLIVQLENTHAVVKQQLERKTNNSHFE